MLERYRELVARRAAREPLQHLLGTAVFGPVTLAVGPGVFTPRPETELLLEWGLKTIADVTAPLVVDLCTGSGALALGVAAARPDATVHAVEVDPAALAWARRNVETHVAAGGTPVTVHAADVREPDLLPELRTRVDLLLCNPPYVPDGTPVPPEVAEWDPPGAVFGGPDGLEIIRAVVTAASALLRPGGAPGHRARRHPRRRGAGPAARRAAVLTDVEEHPDLAGRPRFATAHRAPASDRTTGRSSEPMRRLCRSSDREGGRSVRRTHPTPLSLHGRHTLARVTAPAVPPTYDCADPDARLAGLAAAAPTCGPVGWSSCRPTPSTAWAPTRSPARRSGRCSPPRGGGRTCRSRCSSARGTPSTAWSRACRAAARELVEAFWPGGLSLVLPHAPSLTWDLGVTRGTVMLRMPLHPVALELLREIGPMAVSSANISGRPPATTVAEARRSSATRSRSTSTAGRAG